MKITGGAYIVLRHDRTPNELAVEHVFVSKDAAILWACKLFVHTNDRSPGRVSVHCLPVGDNLGDPSDRGVLKTIETSIVWYSWLTVPKPPEIVVIRND